MTTTAGPSAAEALQAPRGVTDIADRVVEKIAGRAASEIRHVQPPPAKGLSRLSGAADQPTVDAHVDGASVRLDVRLAVTYPTAVHVVARQVQLTVRDRVEALTGLDVAAVRVDVTATPTHGPRRSRVV